MVDIVDSSAAANAANSSGNANGAGSGTANSNRDGGHGASSANAAAVHYGSSDGDECNDDGGDLVGDSTGN